MKVRLFIEKVFTMLNIYFAIGLTVVLSGCSTDDLHKPQGGQTEIPGGTGNGNNEKGESVKGHAP